jgi:hypothetical protein
MKAHLVAFGSIEIDGRRHEHDVVIDRGDVRKRIKKPSKPHRAIYGHTPLSADEDIPWGREPADHRHRGLRFASDHA